MKQLSLDEIKQTELSILIEFDSFCRKHNLVYFLCGGTLLGAIRHNGFIPWDDDIDVFMPRPDYEKFIELTYNKGISEKYETAIYSKKDCFTPTPFIKIYDKTTFVEQHYSKIPLKVWIDIFAIDGLPDDQTKIEKYYKKLSRRKTILGIITSDFSYQQKLYKKIIKIMLKPFLCLYGAERICRLMDKDSQKIKYETSNRVGVKHWGYGSKEAIFKSDLVPEEHSFEGHNFFIPQNFDRYLSNLYGNYMQLPPEDKRIIHGIKAYRIGGDDK